MLGVRGLRVLFALALSSLVACGTSPQGDSGEDVAATSSAVTSGAAKINVGGPAVSPFLADVDGSGGQTITRTHTIDTSGVTNPAPMAVYQSARFGNATYVLPGFVVGKNNTIRLHFAETHWTTPGQRSFSVKINGAFVLQNFDIFVAAGGANKAVVREFTLLPDSAGKYTIQFITVKDQAFVSGIEVALANATATNSPTLSSSCVRPAHLVTTPGAAMPASHVIPVLWGPSVPFPSATIQNFGSVLSGSNYLKWVQNQYGFGPVDLTTAPIVITPTHTGTTLTRDDVGSELAQQITSKVLPPKAIASADSYATDRRNRHGDLVRRLLRLPRALHERRSQRDFRVDSGLVYLFASAEWQLVQRR